MTIQKDSHRFRKSAQMLFVRKFCVNLRNLWESLFRYAWFMHLKGAFRGCTCLKCTNLTKE